MCSLTVTSVSDFIYVCLETRWLSKKPWLLCPGNLLYVPRDAELRREAFVLGRHTRELAARTPVTSRQATNSCREAFILGRHTILRGHVIAQREHAHQRRPITTGISTYICKIRIFV